MGFKLKVDGGSIDMNERQIKNVTFGSDIPNDSNARATDNGAYLKVWGKILFSTADGFADHTLSLAAWSQEPSDSAACYKDVQVEVVSAGQTVRDITLPDAFVVEYSESIDDESGVGEFYLHVKQKKDVTDSVVFSGGFEAQ